MGNIITSGNEHRPRIICHNCKKENIIDIRGWNDDVTKVGEIKCTSCRRSMYVSLLILADTSVQSLGQSVQFIVNALQKANILLQGESEPKSIIKN